MLKTVNMALIQCPVCFSEEFIALFSMKMSQIDTESYKNPKIFRCLKIYAFFPKISKDFVDCNVEKGQKGKNVLSSVLRKEINAVIQTKTV